ncbi:YqaJ viral recombinase family protein [Streptomyces noursei]|uniref:YqaJ viral recombinase family nuclease n=1 Tax=Streptomyces noursei TaxID=1971 RepID=UPI0023B82C8F|nr:YqaJ viral recombinase family protein [Streptomyces noursei]
MTQTVLAGAQAPAAGHGPVVVGDFDPGSAEWHAVRAAGIGGSEIAAVLGLSPYESPYSLWHRKQGMTAPVEETEPMYWGHVHEPGICTRFAELHPEYAVSAAATYAAAGRPWQIANPDRLLVPACDCGMHKPVCCDSEDCGPCCENCPTCPTLVRPPAALLEAKTARTAEGWGAPGTDEIPVHYRAQCLWYLDVLGVSRCYVTVLIAGSEYREYVVDYDPAEAQILRDAGAAFMESLAADDRPAIDGHTATYQAIKALPDGLDDIDVEIAAELRDEYFAALDTAKSADTERRLLAALVLDEIGTGRRAVAAGRTVATRTVRDGRTHSLQPARNRSAA